MSSNPGMTEVIWPDLNESARLINERGDFEARLRRLRIFNFVVGTLHCVQALAQLCVLLLVPQYMAVKLPISMVFVSINTSSVTASVQQQAVFSVAPLVVVFFMISAFFSLFDCHTDMHQGVHCWNWKRL